MENIFKMLNYPIPPTFTSIEEINEWNRTALSAAPKPIPGGDPLPFTSVFEGSLDFYDEPIDFRKLVEDFKSKKIYNEPFDYTKYESRVEIVYTYNDFGDPLLVKRIPIQLNTIDSLKNDYETNFTGKLNKGNGYINNELFFKVDIKELNKKVKITLIYPFCEGEPFEKTGKEVFPNYNIISSLSKYDAIIIETDSILEAKAFLIATGNQAKADSLEKLFNLTIVEKMKNTNAMGLAYLYSIVEPGFFQYKDDKEVFADFNKLISFDADSIISDAADALIKIVSQFTMNDYLYTDLTKINPAKVKTAYHLLNGEMYAENQKISKRLFFAVQLQMGMIGNKKVTIQIKYFVFLTRT